MTTDKPTSSLPKSPFWQALSLAMELGFVIAIPLVIFSLGGRYLDKQIGTAPWLFLAGLMVAILVTTVYVYRKFSRLVKDIDDHSTS